jgi:hypothetical protein
MIEAELKSAIAGRIYGWVRDSSKNIKIGGLTEEERQKTLDAIPQWAWDQLTAFDQKYIIDTYGAPSYANSSR